MRMIQKDAETRDSPQRRVSFPVQKRPKKMNQRNRQTLFRFQSTEKQLQCVIDHNKLVKDIISEQILPMLHVFLYSIDHEENEKLISESDTVLLKYRDTYLCGESRLVYYNYVEDNEIEIEICTVDYLFLFLVM